jgi:hypothetical protein
MHVFISYAKKDTRALAERLFRELNAIEGVSAWMDESLEPASSWARQIEREIDRAEYMVVLISPDVSRPETSEQSHSFVLNEIQRALDSNPRKPILPVLAQRSPMPVEIQTIQRIDATRDEDAAVEEIIAHLCSRAGVPTPAERARAEQARIAAQAEAERQKAVLAEQSRLEAEHQRQRDLEAQRFAAAPKSSPPMPVQTRRAVSNPTVLVRRLPMRGIAIVGVVAALAITIFMAQRTSQSLPDLRISNVQMIEPPFVNSPILINVTVTNEGEQTLSSISVVGNFGGLQGSRGQIIEEIEPAQSLTLQFTEFYSTSGDYQGNVTVDYDSEIAESNENNNSYPTNFSIQDQPIFTPTESITETATTVLDWQPQMQTFSGIDMVRVPAGCFMMGSDDGNDDEQPVHEQCLDEFWIGRTEVTNGQYGSSSRVPVPSDEDFPREYVSWFDAQDFCTSKGLRLPTEAEWEYAARGSQNLIYPWGNTFDPSLVVSRQTSNNQIVAVGSRVGGASWVGALDMAGSLWEWTSSLYEPYPYDAEDGRERDTGNDMNVRRVLRGGSWFEDTADYFLTVVRDSHVPSSALHIGFRCVLS